ncbi:MAG TPA: hypothetical protein VJB98_04300 [Candidatus Paceibacterota bacterium]
MNLRSLTATGALLADKTIADENLARELVRTSYYSEKAAQRWELIGRNGTIVRRWSRGQRGPEEVRVRAPLRAVPKPEEGPRSARRALVIFAIGVAAIFTGYQVIGSWILLLVPAAAGIVLYIDSRKAHPATKP